MENTYWQNYSYNFMRSKLQDITDVKSNSYRLLYRLKCLTSQIGILNDLKNFFSYCEQIQQELLSKTVTEENFVGYRVNGMLYKIPGTNYALKVPNDCKDLSFKSIDTNLSPEDIVNNIVGKLENGALILNYIDGRTISELKKRGTSVEKIITDLSVDACIRYFKKLIDASKIGMFHNLYGENSLINEKFLYIIPIIFEKAFTRKVMLIEDLFFQLGSCLTTKKIANDLLCKSTLALSSIILENTMDASFLSKFEMNIKEKLDIFPISRDLLENVDNRLRKIILLKKIEKFSSGAEEQFTQEIDELVLCLQKYY